MFGYAESVTEEGFIISLACGVDYNLIMLFMEPGLKVTNVSPSGCLFSVVL